MKKILLVSLAFSSLALSLNSMAACSDKLCSGKVDKLYVKNSGDILVGTEGDENALNCGAESKVYVTLRDNSPNREFIYSALLAARASGSPVSIRISEGTFDCNISYVTY